MNDHTKPNKRQILRLKNPLDFGKRRSFPLAQAIIKEFEGFSSTFYMCPGNRKTIGYGHLVKQGETIYEPLSEEQASLLLGQDMQAAYSCLFNQTTVPINPFQEAALVSFIFNLGCGSFTRSTLRQKLNQKNYPGAAQEFLRWIYVEGKENAGLLRRRSREKKLFEGKNNPLTSS